MDNCDAVSCWSPTSKRLCSSNQSTCRSNVTSTRLVEQRVFLCCCPRKVGDAEIYLRSFQVSMNTGPCVSTHKPIPGHVSHLRIRLILSPLTSASLPFSTTVPFCLVVPTFYVRQHIPLGFSSNSFGRTRTDGSRPELTLVVDREASMEPKSGGFRITQSQNLSTNGHAYASYLVPFSFRPLPHGCLPLMSLPCLALFFSSTCFAICHSVPQPPLIYPLLLARHKRAQSPLLQFIQLLDP